ncbi:proline and serine-rich protein 3 [Scyliorhinus canicula]|uniref:proline and serine-rich protein 3 n=1 Tax=Scyliorhinus canicula TaxID=7830 RepID=UPI0018F39459|nr:proline and serine-rich protein 3 [Scyliorhinus canicula]
MASSLEESWPSTESSTAVTPEEVEGGQSRAVSTGRLLASHEALRTDADWSESPKDVPMESSIIAKYIQRFRHGQPLSREDRESAAAEHYRENAEFWWLINSPPSNSTPTQDTKQFSQDIRPFSTEGGVFGDHSPLQLSRFGSLPGKISLPSLPDSSVDLLKSGLHPGGEASQLEPLDQETVHLQERANRLLERSESSSSSAIAVSSDGVGSPSVSDTIEGVSLRPTCSPLCEPTAGRPRISGTSLQRGDITVKQVPTVPNSLYPVRVPALSALPEDDILYQWRLQRKMEAARENQWPLLPKRKSHSPPVRLDRPIGCDEDAHEDRMMVIVPSPQSYWKGDENPSGAPTHCVKTKPVVGAAVNKPALTREPVSAEPLPVHGPVCLQPAGDGQHSDPDVMETGQGEGGGVERGPDPLRGSADKGQSIAERISSQSLTEGGQHSAGAVVGKLLGRVARPERCPSNATERRGRRYQRSCDKRGQNHGSKICSTTSSTLPQFQKPSNSELQLGSRSLLAPRRYRSDLGQESSSDEAWSPSPDSPHAGIVHAARKGGPGSCAQSNVHHVLGQVVSERMFSPPASKQLASKKPKSSSQARREHVPPPPIPGICQAPQAVTQLLEEAEESDGVEFEEDLLLQVLRQQRDWVKQQLREADTRLMMLKDHGGDPLTDQ